MERKELKEWLSNELLMDVTDDTIFIEDLGYSEMDLIIFFERFFKKFDIDSSSFNLDDYLIENISIFDVWFRKKKEKQFGIDHLLKIVLTKKWVDPEINT